MNPNVRLIYNVLKDTITQCKTSLSVLASRHPGVDVTESVSEALRWSRVGYNTEQGVGAQSIDGTSQTSLDLYEKTLARVCTVCIELGKELASLLEVKEALLM